MDNNQQHSGSIVTVGTFDGVHLGHQALLRQLCDEGHRLGLRPVAATFDTHPRAMFGDVSLRLLMPPAERLATLAALVPTVAEMHFSRELADLSACQFLRQVLVGELGARALLIGYDNQFGNRQNYDFDRLADAAAELGVELLHGEPVVVEGQAVSSSRIRRVLQAGDVSLAHRLLGRPHAIYGTVQHGQGRGLSLGYPTANISPEPANLLLPKAGVYAIEALMPDGAIYKGMANLGAQPTFGGETPTIEAHLFGYDGNLYGATLQLLLRHRLRDTQTFDNADALRRQLDADKLQALQLMD